MIKGFDAAAPLGATAIKAAVEAGFEVVFRYYGPESSYKLLMLDEAEQLGEAGLLIFSVFDQQPARALQGYNAGKADAAKALQQAEFIGQPKGSTICFMVNSDQNMTTAVVSRQILGYFSGINSIISDYYQIGGYGSGEVLTALRAHSLIRVRWLAGALGWRGSPDYDRARYWDIKQGIPIAAQSWGNHIGVEYSPNLITDFDQIGAWRPATVSLQDVVPSYAKGMQR